MFSRLLLSSLEAHAVNWVRHNRHNTHARALLRIGNLSVKLIFNYYCNCIESILNFIDSHPTTRLITCANICANHNLNSGSLLYFFFIKQQSTLTIRIRFCPLSLEVALGTFHQRQLTCTIYWTRSLLANSSIIYFSHSLQPFNGVFATRQKKSFETAAISNSLTLRCNLLFAYRIVSERERERLHNLCRIFSSIIHWLLFFCVRCKWYLNIKLNEREFLRCSHNDHT